MERVLLLALVAAAGCAASAVHDNNIPAADVQHGVRPNGEANATASDFAKHFPSGPLDGDAIAELHAKAFSLDLSVIAPRHAKQFSIVGSVLQAEHRSVDVIKGPAVVISYDAVDAQRRGTTLAVFRRLFRDPQIVDLAQPFVLEAGDDLRPLEGTSWSLSGLYWEYRAERDSTDCAAFHPDDVIGC